MASWGSQSLHSLIRVYQLLLRPILGPNCRFMPSCSDYAITAIGMHGAVRGSGLAVRRIVRCNPWCDGGHDPVPPVGLRSDAHSSPAHSSQAHSSQAHSSQAHSSHAHSSHESPAAR